MNSDRYNSPHWTESDLIGRLYGLEPAAGRSIDHLAECQDCGGRWKAVEAGRRALLGSALPSGDALEERLRLQRRAVWARIERPHQRLLWRMIPVTATALMIFAGLALHQTRQPLVQSQIASTVSDAQFFNEIASMVNEETPRAADPLQGLFDNSATPAAAEAQ